MVKHTARLANRQTIDHATSVGEAARSFRRLSAATLELFEVREEADLAAALSDSHPDNDELLSHAVDMLDQVRDREAALGEHHDKLKNGRESWRSALKIGRDIARAAILGSGELYGAQIELERQLPQLIALAKSCYEAQIDAGILPEAVRERLPMLDMLGYLVMDSGRGRDRKLTVGAAHYKDGLISLFLQLVGNKAELEKVFLHEVSHMLAGPIVRGTSKEKKAVVAEKRGLTLYVNGQRGVWLDEAITEHIAVGIADRPVGLTIDINAFGSDCYPIERHVLKTIVNTAGINAKLFTDAYFEEIRTVDGVPTHQKSITNRQLLFNTIYNNYGPRFLVEITKMFNALEDGAPTDDTFAKRVGEIDQFIADRYDQYGAKEKPYHADVDITIPGEASNRLAHSVAKERWSKLMLGRYEKAKTVELSDEELLYLFLSDPVVDDKALYEKRLLYKVAKGIYDRRYPKREQDADVDDSYDDDDFSDVVDRELLERFPADVLFTRVLKNIGCCDILINNYKDFDGKVDWGLLVAVAERTPDDNPFIEKLHRFLAQHGLDHSSLPSINTTYAV